MIRGSVMCVALRPLLRPRFTAFVLPIALAAVLGGCAGKWGKVDSTVTASVPQPALTEAQVQEAVTGWGDRYARKPQDKEVALNYAAALARSGRNAQAVAVLQKLTLKYGKDREVLSMYGKTLAANGNFDEALKIIRRAQTPDHPDWRLLSAEAAILDQTGQNEAARALYKQALDVAPNEPTIHSNLGMSYVVTGDLKEAEKVLRRAATLPGADGRVRQNLALVLGLQGRFAEAEKVATADLPPEEAAANISYLRMMLAQPDNWKTLNGAPVEPAASAKG